jgi:hypothetical protein
MRSTPPHRLRPAGRALPLLLLALACSLSTPADAQWKWRDKDGQINASDRPPPKDIPEKDILGRPVPEGRRYMPALAPAGMAASAALPASAPTTLLEREVQARKRSAEQEQAAKDKAEEEKASARRAESCRNARTQLAALEGGQRIARLNDKGEREVLDDKGRAEELRRAREIVATDCR